MRAEKPGHRTGMGVGLGTNPAAGLRAKRQKLVYLGPIELKPFQRFQQIRMADQVYLKHVHQTSGQGLRESTDQISCL